MVEVCDRVGKRSRYNFASKRNRSKPMDGLSAIRELTCLSAEGRPMKIGTGAVLLNLDAR
jgi:hypothetical protein